MLVSQQPVVEISIPEIGMNLDTAAASASVVRADDRLDLFKDRRSPVLLRHPLVDLMKERGD
jgi:hypothetical protein